MQLIGPLADTDSAHLLCSASCQQQGKQLFMHDAPAACRDCVYPQADDRLCRSSARLCCRPANTAALLQWRWLTLVDVGVVGHLCPLACTLLSGGILPVAGLLQLSNLGPAGRQAHGEHMVIMHPSQQLQQLAKPLSTPPAGAHHSQSRVARALLQQQQAWPLKVQPASICARQACQGCPKCAHICSSSSRLTSGACTRKPSLMLQRIAEQSWTHHALF